MSKIGSSFSGGNETNFAAKSIWKAAGYKLLEGQETRDKKRTTHIAFVLMYWYFTFALFNAIKFGMSAMHTLLHKQYLSSLLDFYFSF